MGFDGLLEYGWDLRWADRLGEVPGRPVPGRVVRHDGTALEVAGPDGTVTVTLATRLEPEPTVGDWVAMTDGHPVAVLARRSLLRRRAAVDHEEQVLAANVDIVFLVCGLDRPVKAGRIQRGVILATDAGAEAVVVLTKAVLVEEPRSLADRVVEANPDVTVVVTSVREGVGVDELACLARNRTVVLMGESGAGKSSIVNTLLDDDVAAVGSVRGSDAKGRHTTTNRFLHLLPGGGTLIDSPGIRSVGLWSEPEAVAATFADVTGLADGCRFADCGHDTEPGCAVKAAVSHGELAASRLVAWSNLAEETKVRSPRRRKGRQAPRPRNRR